MTTHTQGIAGLLNLIQYRNDAQGIADLQKLIQYRNEAQGSVELSISQG